MKFAKFLFLVAIFVLPFGTDLFVADFSGRGNLPRFQEFSSFFIYGIELFVLLACATVLFLARKEENVSEEKKKLTRDFRLPGLFLLFTLVAFGVSMSSAGFVFFSRLVLAVSFMGVVASVFKAKIVSFSDCAGAIATSTLLQGILGILQFARQRSVGVWFLGEPAVDFWTTGVGRVFADGGRLLRSFGTTPHANIYAAFLVLGLASLYYFFLKEDEKKFSVKRIVLSFGILILFCALLFSFSRSGWIGAGVLTVSVLVFAFFNPTLKFKAGVLLVRLVAIGVLVMFAFGHLAVPRAAISLKTDPSFNYRLTYNQMGLETIQKNPLGVGLANQVEYGVTTGLYEKYGIGSDEPWNWQPIHNLYLLIASEAGIPALLALLSLFAVLGYRVFRQLKEKGNGDSAARVCALGTFVAFLVLGLSDHYFWDLVSGRLMFWFLLGILLGLSPNLATGGTGDRKAI